MQTNVDLLTNTHRRIKILAIERGMPMKDLWTPWLDYLSHLKPEHCLDALLAIPEDYFLTVPPRTAITQAVAREAEVAAGHMPPESILMRRPAPANCIPINTTTPADERRST